MTSDEGAEAGGSGGDTDAGTCEPLVGRGSAGRVDLDPDLDPGAAPPEADPHPGGSGPGRAPTRRPVPRPPWSPPRTGRPWSWPWPWSWSSTAVNPAGARFGLGVALAVVLGLAWVAVGRSGSGSAAPAVPATASSPMRSQAPPSTARPLPTPVDRGVAVPAWVPAEIAATCRAHASAAVRTTVVVDCSPGRGVAHLEFRAFGSVARLRAAYAIGPAPGARSGAPACARGVAEERSWSAVTAPSVPLGRYRCSVTGGTARIAWTSEHTGADDVGVLALATRPDADLRALYQWWTTVPGPIATRPETRARPDL